jgi:hypothetical protein
VATPTARQARSHHAQQAAIAAAAVRAIRVLFQRRRPIIEVAATVARFQGEAARTSAVAIAEMAGSRSPLVLPDVFAGISSKGFPISEPIIATIDSVVPAPVEPLPDAWWDDAAAFVARVEQLVESEVRDAGRTASQVEFVARPDWTNYVRMLTPPSCPRCTILAGRIYRDLEEFSRHPSTCDCVMVPVENWESAHDAGYVSSPQEAFEKGHVRGLSKADEQAIRDGADIGTVVNAAQGMVKTTAFGNRVKATTYGTTKRAAWRKANPTRLVRLRPEAIYEFAKDREDAIRLLKLYGYIR